MDAKKKILIVEDNPQQQIALYDAMAKAGYLVRRASSGDEGFQMAVSTVPDLIIVDKMMPNTNGLMMVNMIRAHDDWGKNVPVFFLSNVAATSEEENEMMKFLKPREYLSKSETSLETIVQKARAVFDETKPVAANA